jgi:hypothetical protein
MSHVLRLRVNRVEHWRPDHSDTGPIFTQVEVRMAEFANCGVGLTAGPALAFEHQADGQYVPTRLVLNFTGKVTDFEPGDYVAVTLEKAAPAPEPDRQEIPF